jgi:hypothetical protein
MDNHRHAMKVFLKKLADSGAVYALALVLGGLAFFYFRNGAEYFSGKSGGAYWDHRNYCETHAEGQVKIYSQLVGCRRILAYRTYCSRHLDGAISIGRDTIQCDQFLGVQDDHSPWDVF